VIRAGRQLDGTCQAEVVRCVPRSRYATGRERRRSEDFTRGILATQGQDDGRRAIVELLALGAAPSVTRTVYRVDARAAVGVPEI
jgi:hypothetical protein